MAACSGSVAGTENCASSADFTATGSNKCGRGFGSVNGITLGSLTGNLGVLPVPLCADSVAPVHATSHGSRHSPAFEQELDPRTLDPVD